MRQREVKELPQGDTAIRSQIWDLNLGHLVPKAVFSPYTYALSVTYLVYGHIRKHKCGNI